mmetsp:Transcript_6073/g.17861  ORF Transcript_6073/g.17861 Transcript_6073/m.17861 type:complete len:265 (-) Transcript_6073:101-895(-)
MLDASNVTSNDGKTYSSTLNPPSIEIFTPSSTSTSAFTVHHPKGGCSFSIATSTVATPKTSKLASDFLKIVLSMESFTSMTQVVAPSFCLINAAFSISATNARILIFCPGAYTGLSVSTCTKVLAEATLSRALSFETTLTFVFAAYVLAVPSYIASSYSRPVSREDGTPSSNSKISSSLVFVTSIAVDATTRFVSSSKKRISAPALVTPAYPHVLFRPTTNVRSHTIVTPARTTLSFNAHVTTNATHIRKTHLLLFPIIMMLSL